MGADVLILAEIHRAIERLGESQRPTTPDEASRIVRSSALTSTLQSICDSWAEEALEDDAILAMLRDWNAGKPVFSEVYASREEPPAEN